MRDAAEVTATDHSTGVSWLELFFDLVLVAYLGYTNHLLTHSSGNDEAIQLALFSGITVFVVWMNTTIIGNMFPSKRSLREILIVLQMLFLLIAMLSFDPDGGLLNSTGLAAFGLIYLCAAGMYLEVAVRDSAARARTGLAIATTTMAGVICLVASPFLSRESDSHYAFGVIATTAALVAAAPLVAVFGRNVNTAFPIRREHLDERWGQFTLIALGEGFLLVVELLRGRTVIPNIPVFVLVFFTLFAFWRLYFYGAMRVPSPGVRYRFNSLMLSQLLLLIGILGSIDILAQGVGVDLHLGNDFMILGGSLAIVMSGLALATWARRDAVDRPVVVDIGLAIAFACYGYFGQYHSGLSIEVFIATCCAALLLYAVLQRQIDPLSRR